MYPILMVCTVLTLLASIYSIWNKEQLQAGYEGMLKMWGTKENLKMAIWSNLALSALWWSILYKVGYLTPIMITLNLINQVLSWLLLYKYLTMEEN